jgi:DNA-binding transcriptional LysR family regulator
MELNELRSLIALSELGNISEVAKRLHLSPPAIHKQLKTLEGELGVPLYEKAGKQLQLTQAAAIMLPHIKEMLAHYQFAITALDEFKGLKRGSVRVGIGPSSYIFPAILKRFRPSHVEIEIIVETGNTPTLLEDLRNGALDLALVTSPDLGERKDFVIEAVWAFEMVLVSQFKRSPARPRLAELREERFISFRQGSRMQEPIDRYFSQNGFEPKVVMRFDNPEIIRTMVLSGLGVAILPLWVVHHDIRDKRLSIVRPVEPTPFSKVALIRRKSNYVPRPVQGFIDAAAAIEHRDIPMLVAQRSPGSPNSQIGNRQ